MTATGRCFKATEWSISHSPLSGWISGSRLIYPGPALVCFACEPCELMIRLCYLPGFLTPFDASTYRASLGYVMSLPPGRLLNCTLRSRRAEDEAGAGGIQIVHLGEGEGR